MQANDSFLTIFVSSRIQTWNIEFAVLYPTDFKGHLYCMMNTWLPLPVVKKKEAVLRPVLISFMRNRWPVDSYVRKRRESEHVRHQYTGHHTKDCRSPSKTSINPNWTPNGN